MPQETLVKPQEPLSEVRSGEQCAHYWIIEPPNEATSKGICKICGAEKDFDNFISTDMEWK